jgi:16S rRNA (uracil1498-N3)-methyltransferase
LEEPIIYESAIQIAGDGDGLKAIAWEQESDNKMINDWKSSNKAHIFIGPEGGYSEDEIAFSVKYKVKSFSLGKRILRAETASIFVASLYLSL